MILKRIATAVLAVLMTVSAFAITASAAAKPYEVGDGYISLDFSAICDGLVDPAYKSATFEKNVEFEGMNAVKITPNPEGCAANPTKTYRIESYSLADFESEGVYMEVPQYKYVGVTYYYDTDSPSYNGPMQIRVLPSFNRANKDITAKSKHPIVTNQWTEAIFSIATIKPHDDPVKPYMTQMHLLPFYDTQLGALKETDVLYVAKYTFYKENPDPSATATVKFVKDTPEAAGDEKQTEYKIGEMYTLPECHFTHSNGTFKGWQSSYDDKIYQPGDRVEAIDMTVSYTALWEIQKTYPELITLNFADYEDGIVNSRDTAKLEHTEFDGKNVVKITPNPVSTAEDQIRIDGYSYSGAEINLDVYHWVGVEYYLDAADAQGMKMYTIMHRNGNIFPEGKACSASATEPLIAGKWATAYFDYTKVQNVLDPTVLKHNLCQMHLYPFGGKETLPKLSADSPMYISTITFYKEQPKTDTHTSYMNGYTDGTFLPGGTMTRAEACTVIARLLEAEENIIGTSAFTDVTSADWFAKYIGFCEVKGLLAAYSGNFLPNQPITRAEFSELVYLTGLAQDKGIVASFTDTAGHAKYTSIMAAASAGLINGYKEADDTYTFRPDNTITRAEVVTIINRARGRSMTRDTINSDLIKIFLDVDTTHWAFADIAEATVDHTVVDGKWNNMLENPVIALSEMVDKKSYYRLSEGRAKVAELDAYEAQRISEIRNTASDLSKVTGKKIYVSVAGSDENDGLTESTPLKTVAKANNIALRGDAVLLRRGEVRREQFQARPGVTYSAYGEGAKPKIYGSPENGADPEKWALVHEDAATGALIWMYKNQNFKDIGGIIFNDGEGYAVKDSPYYLKDVGYFLNNNKKDLYDYKTGLANFEFFHKADSALSGNTIKVSEATGPLYLRCDNGNPGKIFDSIEFIPRGAAVSVGTNSDVTIDNLCIMYSSFGISASTQQNLRITNCEIGWIGGNVSGYQAGGFPIRYGNGVEVYGGCDGYVIDNCYVYQCYDAGITHQCNVSNNPNVYENNITYSNNVLTDSVYNIEYFLYASSAGKRQGKNVLFEGNLCRRAGFGFGSSRPDGNNQRHIRSGSGRNYFENFVIRNNIFDRSVYELFETATEYTETIPAMQGNTYIQGIGNKFFSYGKGVGVKTNVDIAAEHAVTAVLGDSTGKVYFVDNIPYFVHNYTTAKTSPVTEDDRKGFEVTVPEQEKPAEEEKNEEKIEPEASESTTVVAPLLEKYAATKAINEVRKCTEAVLVPKEGTNPAHHHTTPVNTSDYYVLECYSFKAEGLTEGVVYVKVLMRANAVYTPVIDLYQMTDKDGNSVSGSVHGDALSKTNGTGQWEEIIIKVKKLPDGVTGFKQMQLRPAGTVQGTSFFENGQLKVADACIDVAAWAVFPNLASAESFDLMAAALAK